MNDQKPRSGRLKSGWLGRPGGGKVEVEGEGRGKVAGREEEEGGSGWMEESIQAVEGLVKRSHVLAKIISFLD